MPSKIPTAEIPDRLRTLTALDLEGRPVELGGLWRQKPAVLVLVRHFG